MESDIPRRRILLTSALPYANGHIHLGHLVEYLQTDIWSRFQRLRGHDCRYFCADDTHGAAIMIRARQEGRPESALIAEMSAAHQADFAAFEIAFDHYGSTHSSANRDICGQLWAGLRARDMVVERSVERLYDPEAGSFLADRFVKGTCPRCGATDQYGDSCEKCGATYAASELVDPVSTLSGARPELRSSRQLFVRIEDLRAFLEDWIDGSRTPAAPGDDGRHLQSEVARYLRGHFLKAGEPLRDWDVSRPAPYFGFEIPDSPGNYWYVWFDAPIGYIASCREWCERQGEDFAAWWGPASTANRATEIVHVIGKDITYFHTVFWPAVLQAGGFKLPDRVQIHGFLTVNGEKMSKSRGTFVLARTYAETIGEPSYLRYYYASKLNGAVDDLDLNLDEFIAKVNSDLVGKVVNLASRSARFIAGELLRPDGSGPALAIAAATEDIAANYEGWNFAAAMREIMALADQANAFVEERAPWTLAKDPARRAELLAVCTAALDAYWRLVLLLAPVLPRLAADSARLFGLEPESLRWTSSIDGCTVGTFAHLLPRLDAARVAAMIDRSTQAETAAPATPSVEPLATTCSFADFQKVDLRVAEVLAAEVVAGADKLLRLRISLGPLGERQIIAGIKKAYQPQSLVGRRIVVVANLAARQMKFGTSEGMALAAGNETGLFLLAPDDGACPGDPVR